MAAAATSNPMTRDRQRQLVQEAKRGDVEAFAEVFEELRTTVYAIAYRVVGPDDADDVVMETYLKAWKAIPRFNERSALKTWLYRITHNCAVDFIRARKRSKEQPLRQDEHDDRTMSDLEDTSQPTPAELRMKTEDAQQLHQALSRLDPIHRVAIQLRYSDELSYSEIAAATGVSIGTVMSRLFNAKRKLRRIIRQLGYS